METRPIGPATCHALCSRPIAQQVGELSYHNSNNNTSPIGRSKVSCINPICSVHALFRVKDLQSLGQAETKLLYTLHWIMLFASDECAEENPEEGAKKATGKCHQNYLFSVPAISVGLLILSLATPLNR